MPVNNPRVPPENKKVFKTLDTFIITHCIAYLQQATFLFVNGISWNFSKTTVSKSLEYMQSFIKIGGVVFE